MAGTNDGTTISHLPEEIRANVFAAVSDTRTRNSLSLVSRGFRLLERKTRTSLTLRGNARDLHRLPTSFSHVTHLDLSLIDVKVSCCVNLDAAACLRTLEPICDRIERLHLDCVWNGLKESDILGQGFLNFDLNGVDEMYSSDVNGAEFVDYFGAMECEETSKKKIQRCNYELEVDDCFVQSNGSGYC